MFQQLKLFSLLIDCPHSDMSSMNHSRTCTISNFSIHFNAQNIFLIDFVIQKLAQGKRESRKRNLLILLYDVDYKGHRCFSKEQKTKCSLYIYIKPQGYGGKVYTIVIMKMTFREY